MSMDTQQDHENPVNTNEEDKDDIKEPRYYCPFDLNERDEDENTPLHVAIHALKLDCVELLIGAGVAINRRSDGSTPLVRLLSFYSIFKRILKLLNFIITNSIWQSALEPYPKIKPLASTASNFLSNMEQIY